MIRLNSFGFLKISGIDAVSFMQGYTTCDLATLDEHHAVMGAVCNIQGRMLTSFLAVSDGQDLILRMHRPLVEKTITFLSKYIVFSKAELSDISESLVCYGLLEPGESLTVTREGEGQDSFRIGLGNRQELWTTEELESSIDEGDWLAAEVEAGVAWVSEANSEEFLPQMFNYHELDAIDFSKGCYLGQEIVARAQYRGELKRKLKRLSPADADDGVVVAASADAVLAVVSTR